MTVDPIGAVAAQQVLPYSPPAASAIQASQEAPVSFATWLQNEIAGVNADIVAADDGVRRLAIGEPVSLHELMINLERARLRFELVLQVRNKVLEAYQDLLRTQI